MTELTESEKQAARALVQKQVDAIFEAAYLLYAAGKAAAAPVVAPTPEPVPEVPSQPAVPTSTGTFDVKVYSASADKTVVVSADLGIIPKRTLIAFGKGRQTNVETVSAPADSKMTLTLSEPAHDTPGQLKKLAGTTATISDRYPGTTAPAVPPVVAIPVPEKPTAETPAPTPTPGVEYVTLAVRNLDYDDWPKGVWKGPQAGLAPDPEQMAANPESFAQGRQVLLGDGTTRTITGSNGNLWFDGAALDPAKCGYPAVVKAVKVASTPVVTLPINTQPIVTAPGRKRGRLCLNLGAGAGGDSILPGMQGRNRGYATEAEIVHAVYVLKCRHFRIGGLWETFIQPGGKSQLYTGTVNGGPSAIDELIRVLSSLADKGCTAMPDPFHNYGGYSSTSTSLDRIKMGEPGGPSVKRAVLDHKAVLLAVKANPKAWSAMTEWDTMNEFVGVSAANIKAFNQEFVNVCGPIMDGKITVIEGDLWSSTVNWVTLNPGYADLTYPAGVSKVKCSGHLYLDQASSGFYNGDRVSDLDAAAGITTDNIGIKRLAPMEADVKANGLDMNIGEHMVPGNLPKLIKGSENMIRYCIANGIDVHIFANSTWLDETHNILMPKNKPYLDMLMSIWAQEAEAA
jgi:hypothetical protein